MKNLSNRFLPFFALAVIVTISLSCQTSQISINRAELQKVKTVAVMDFESAPGIGKSVVRECEEAFRGNLITAGFNVVERKKLNAIMKEHEINQSGLTGGAMQLGKLSGAQGLLIGNVTKNRREVKWVDYNKRIKVTRNNKQEYITVKRRKRMKFFTFQINIRLVASQTGNTILTLKNKYPERRYEMTSTTTLDRFRERILNQMGDDLKDAIEDD